MIYKNFHFQIVIRLLLAFANMFAILYPILNSPFENVVFMVSILSALLFTQIYFLFRYLKRSHKLLLGALEMLNTGQYSFTANEIKGLKSIDEISSNLNKTIDSFKEINAKYQSQLNYIELLVEKLDVGILAIKKNGKIELSNSAVQNILGLNKITHLDDIAKKHAILAETIQNSNFSRHLILDLKSSNSAKQISLKISSIEILGKQQKLVSIHDISGEIIKTETEAWNRLLKILNHEIFNSVTPLSSLSNTLKMMIKNDDGEIKSSAELSDDEVLDIAESIEIIQQRSNNLMNFINGFKKLAKVPPPKVEKINLEKLLNQSVSLFKNETEKKGIFISVKPEKDIEINADQSQLEQAIINLISNSIYALDEIEDKKIELRSFTNGNSKCIEIWDNGRGIPEENMDRIFIPFYSTRKNGSGIGLSLTRYLVQLNNGTINVKSEVKKETQFTLIFN
jgi:two-component system, NtrC family, nitrogen regulation sensor histidine kinase NtrY